MWFDKQQIKEFVALAFKPQYLAYAHIKKNVDHNVAHYAMENYTHIPLTNLELEHQIIFNPTALSKQLDALLHIHKNIYTEIRISLEGPSIVEKIIERNITAEKDCSEQFKHLVWHDTPLSPSHSYLCGIRRELLFQYQLLAIANNFEITCITTSTMSLLNCYQKCSQKNDTPISSLNEIRDFISSQNIATLCSHVPFTDNPILIAELIGLCMAELNYENN
jgi:hypothetical protein